MIRSIGFGPNCHLSPLFAVQQQAHFSFAARSLAKCCYIDGFVSERAENSFSPSAALHQHHDQGGKHLPGVGGRQLRNHQHGSNLSPRVTKGTHMICKSSCDFILRWRWSDLTCPHPQLAPNTQRVNLWRVRPVWPCCFCSFATRNDGCKSQLVSVLWLVPGTPYMHLCELSDPRQSLRPARWCPSNLYNQHQGEEFYRYRNVEYVFSQESPTCVPIDLSI